jgi:hypothetical protein
MNRDDVRVFLIAGILAVFVLCTAAFIHAAHAAHAADAQQKPTGFTCWTIRKAVYLYGESAVIDWARARGVSEAEIVNAKRCLK